MLRHKEARRGERMIVRFKKDTEKGLILCIDYPKCRCKGHYIYEKHQPGKRFSELLKKAGGRMSKKEECNHEVLNYRTSHRRISKMGGILNGNG